MGGKGSGRHPLRNISYNAAHNRIRRAWGSATQYSCIKCFRAAQDWAYDGTDPEEFSGDGRRWSGFLEFYMPMCKSCHKLLDNEAGGRRQPCWCGEAPHAKNLCSRHYERRKHSIRKMLRSRAERGSVADATTRGSEGGKPYAHIEHR